MVQILVIAAHPDDETYGVGGAIARHVQAGDIVDVIILTDGVTARHNKIDQQKTVARKACSTLGVNYVHFAGLPDQKLDGVPLLEVIKPIYELVNDIKPQIIYTHHGNDVNQDHRTVFDATLVAVRPFGDDPAKRVLCYETPSSTEWGPPFSNWAFLPNVYIDISETLEIKMRAIEVYRETFQSEVKPFPHPRSPEAVRIYVQHRGITVGMQAAEAFSLVRELL